MDLRSTLAESSLFAGLAPDALDALAAIATPIELRSGERLFSEGDTAEHVYIVATGRLRVLIGDRIVGFIGRLEPAGEVGMLSGEVRAGSIETVRDSLLIQIPNDRLMEFLVGHPSALVAITQVLIKRLRQNQRQEHLASARSARTFAVISTSSEINASAFAHDLHRELKALDKASLVTAASVESALGEGMAHSTDGPGNARLVEWLNGIEREHRFLTYCASGDPDAWAHRCMRQADRVIVLADARTTPISTPMIDALSRSSILADIELVLLRPMESGGGDVLAWKSLTGARAHHFLRPGNERDLRRLVRLLTGRALGLILGGGGARGFAHIGLMRALEELQMPIDIAGGSSMGALISSMLACGYSSHEMLHLLRETFVTHNYLNDYMFPRVALVKGRKFLRRLREVFGEQLIEHLRLPWFCVTSNLTRGTAMVHDSGPLEIWLAASMSVPGIFPPVIYKGELLADGAVVNSLPTDVLQTLQRGPIIASDVSTEGSIRAPGIEGPDPEGLLDHWPGPGDPPSLRDILFRTATLTSESGVRRRAASADLYLRMPVGSIGMFEWKRVEEIVERGYQYAMEHLQPARESLLK